MIEEKKHENIKLKKIIQFFVCFILILFSNCRVSYITDSGDNTIPDLVYRQWCLSTFSSDDCIL